MDPRDGVGEKGEGERAARVEPDGISRTQALAVNVGRVIGTARR